MNDFRANESLSEQIARHIGNMIVNGELKAGDRIQELRIAAELNVSRGSVREAYLILERRYLIEIMPRKGAVVAQLTPAHVKNIYEMNIALLSLLVKRAALEWQDQDLQPFMMLAQEMHQHIQNGEIRRFHDATFEFVRLSHKFTDNVYLTEMLDNLQPPIARTYYLLLSKTSEEMQSSLQAFQTIMEKVAQRDATGAVAAVEAFGNHLCALVLLHLAQ